MIGIRQGFHPAQKHAAPDTLKFRKVISSFSGTTAFFTGPNNKYDDGSDIPDGSLLIRSHKTTIDEDAIGYASNRGGSDKSNLYAECIIRKSHKLKCRGYIQGGADNPNSVIVKDVPKDLAE